MVVIIPDINHCSMEGAVNSKRKLNEMRIFSQKAKGLPPRIPSIIAQCNSSIASRWIENITEIALKIGLG
jgi:hypothetical protein